MFWAKKKQLSKCDGCNCSTNCKGSRHIRGQPRNKKLRRKIESMFQPELCCPKSCAIFGALDRPYSEKLQTRCITKQSKADANSLGTPVGMVCSRACMRPSLETDVQSKRFRTYLKAFALIYLLPENEWTEENIDQLLQEGIDWHRASAGKSSVVSFSRSPFALSDGDMRLAGPENVTTKTENNSLYSGNIGTNSSVSERSSLHNETNFRTQSFTKTERERESIQTFMLKEHNFSIQLLPVFNVNERLKIEPVLSNLKKYMRAFFQKLRYCLFWTEEFGYLLIWRRRSAFFVLDLNGRKKASFTYIDRKGQGVAMLMCLKSLDNVIYLITRLSGASKTDLFQLRGLIVTRLETPDGQIFSRETNVRSLEFIVISDDYAFLKSQVHLSLNRHDHLRNRSSIMVGVAAMIAAKIDHAASWSTYILDRIICLGVQMCRNCWDSCTKQPINLDTFPTQLRLGQYVAELMLLPSVRFGKWRCAKPFRDTDLERLLIGALEEHKSVLFQINNQMYAIWLSHNYYYLMDPYKHTIDTNSQEETEKVKVATLRMFRSKVTFLRVFHTMLTESNRSSTFYIHALKFKNLQEVPYGYALKPRPVGEHMEVQSLNDTICFTGDYQECIDELSKDSGYELDVISYTDQPLYAGTVFEVPKFEDTTEEAEEEESELEGIELNDDLDMAAQKIDKVKSVDSKIKTNQNLTKSRSKTIVNPQTLTKESSQRFSAKKKEAHILQQVNEHSEEELQTKEFDSQKREFVKSRKNKFHRLKIQTEINKRKKVWTCDTQKEGQKPEPEQEDCNCGKSALYPGYSKVPQNIAVCGSESGTIESITRLMCSAFKCADRMLLLTPWGNYIVFRESEDDGKTYYVFEGCICNVDHFRHMDLRFGTAGLKPFLHKCQVVRYIIDRREAKALSSLRKRLDDSCQHLESLKARGP